ncbi:MAG: T9SS type A sorting domain-containing protein, partial [Flavobacteriia bacterium]
AILNQGYDHCGNIKPTLDGGFIAVGMNSVIIDGQNQLNGGSNIFVLKVHGDGSAYVQTDTVFTTNQLVGLKPAFEGSKVLVFPNPVSADLTIVWPGNEAKAIELYNAQGALLLKETVAAPYGIPMTTFASGLYLLKLEGQSYPIIKH